MNEVSKIRERIEPYLQGKVIDIGCSDCKVTKDAIGVDGRRLPGVDIVTDNVELLSNVIGIGVADTVFSSHILEHLPNDTAALMNWWLLLKDGGYLILYLPDANMYNNDNNPEHMRMYTYESFMFYFTHVFCGVGKDFTGKSFKQYFHVIESSKDFGEDRYSFLLVAQKVKEI